MDPIVLVPLDGTQVALTALPVAEALAEATGSVLRLVHVTDRPLESRELVERVGLPLERLPRSLIDRLAGPPAAAIVRAARESGSRMVVMCTRTGAPKPRPGLGSTAAAVVGAAPCPVVLVRPEHSLLPWRLRHILVPHDGTPATAAALRPAARLAKSAGAMLTVLHVAATYPSAQPSEAGTFAAPQYMDQPHHEWQLWKREFLERLRCECGLDEAILPRLHVARGDPGDEIVRFCREHAVDLVALGWHGRLDTGRAHTVKTVVESAPCPVLLTS